MTAGSKGSNGFNQKQPSTIAYQFGNRVPFVHLLPDKWGLGSTINQGPSEDQEEDKAPPKHKSRTRANKGGRKGFFV